MFFRQKKLELLLKFSSQFEILYRSGLGFKASLLNLKQVCVGAEMRRKINGMIARVEQGQSFAETLSAYPDLFEPFYIEMLKVGEKTGQLGQVLKIVNEYYQEKLLFRKNILQALHYPCVIMSLMLVLSFGLCFSIVPRFQSIFASFHAPLPLLTQVLFSSVNFVTEHFILIFLSGVVCSYLIWRAFKKYSTIWMQNERMLRLPFFGRFYHRCLLLKFFYILGLALEAGLSVEEALKLMRGLFYNSPFTRVLPLLLYDLRQGRSLTVIFKRRRYFPEICTSLIAVAEVTGSLDVQFLKLSEIFKAEVADYLECFKLNLEPAMMLITGILVGGMVLAIYYPIFSLGNVV